MTKSSSSPIASLSIDDLESMNACHKGINEFQYAKEKAGPAAKLSQIAEHISLDYILWAIKRIDKKLYRMLACDYAEHTLHLFESKYPEDMRPRNAIVASRKVYAAAADAAYAAAAAAYAAAADAAYAAYAAAYATNAAAAYAAAYAANAAAYATNAAAAANAAAAYAAAADAAAAADVAAYAAADAAYAAAAKQNENQWQHSHTIKIIQAYESNTLDWNRMSLTESITIL